MTRSESLSRHSERPSHCEATTSRGGFCSRPTTVAIRAVAGTRGFDIDMEWWLCTFHARYWAVRRHPENVLPLIGDARVVALIEHDRLLRQEPMTKLALSEEQK